MKEVEEILAFLAKICNTFSRLIQASTKQINLFQERRTALISAAVTGKIDMRNWRPPESGDADEEGVA